MDLAFNWTKLKEDTLNIDFVPDKIWINFWEALDLEDKDFNIILKLYNKFYDAEIIMENLGLKNKLLMKYLFNSIHRVKVLER